MILSTISLHEISWLDVYLCRAWGDCFNQFLTVNNVKIYNTVLVNSRELFDKSQNKPLLYFCVLFFKEILPVSQFV